MKQKDIMFLLFSFVILTIAWIAFTIIHNSITSTIPSVTQEQISSINPSFDLKTIRALETRQKATTSFSIQSPTSTTAGIISPTQQPTPTTITTEPIAIITVTQVT